MGKTHREHRVFLKDVLISSLSAFGGPQSHMAVFLEQMVKKKKYLSEEELIELMALCSMLPGPTSTQTIVSMGYKQGGPVLAGLTMIVWALPILLIMGALSFAFVLAEHFTQFHTLLRYIGPMAVGFLLAAAFTIGRKVVKDRFTALLLIISASLTFFFRAPWLFPLVLIAGGVAEVLRHKSKNPGAPLINKVEIRPQWTYLVLFLLLVVLSLLLRNLTHHPLVIIFESFYRYGYLVFGGGQVVIPMMVSELVEIQQFMTAEEFLAGYGFVQGLPGPMFSFSAFAGGLAGRNGGVVQQILGALLGGVGIFLPGLLLIYFFYPLWEDLKKIGGIKIALTGINAAAGGLLVSAVPLMLMKTGLEPVNLAVTLLTFLVLKFTKLPAPLWVLLTLAAGFMVGR
ncbi:MAG: chromate efflux transporter [Spirochaetales bacterium]|nr:chromate efflux transporter [Spirochaetales bacterium]